MRRYRAAALFITLFVLAAAFAPARAGADGVSIDGAAALLASGKTDEAYGAYMALLREDPENYAVNLGLARAALASNRPHHAIMAYDRLLAKYPGDAALWRGMAEAYAAAGDGERAELCLARAEDASRGEPGRSGSSAPRFRKTARLKAWVYFDSNANQWAGSSEIRVGSMTIRLLNSDRVETPGLYLGGRLDAVYRLSENGPWYATGGIAANLRYGFDGGLREIDRTYSQWYKVYAGVRHAGEANFFDFAVAAEIFDYDFYDTVYSYGADAVFLRAAAPRFHLITRAGISNRRYVRSMAQTGTYGYVGQYFRFIFGENAHEFTLGARYIGADADSAGYSYSGPEYSAFFNFKIGDNLEISPGVIYAEERYDAPGMPWESHDRRDDSVSYNLGVTRRLSKTASVEFMYQYLDNSSNSAFSSYDRHNASLGIAWTF